MNPVDPHTSSSEKQSAEEGRNSGLVKLASEGGETLQELAEQGNRERVKNRTEVVKQCKGPDKCQGSF